MKIVLVSLVTPTSDNFRAASALSYHLLKYRPKDVEVVCYSFNTNGVPAYMISKVEKELNMKIQLVKSSRLIYWLFKLHLGFLKNLLPYPFAYYNKLSKSVVEEIKRMCPDGIWINGDALSATAKMFPEYRRVMTMPDCVPLYYHRLMGDKFTFDSWLQMMAKCDQYVKNIRMEREYPSDENIVYHFVGQADLDYFRTINPNARGVFFRHPHYNYLPDKVINFSEPKIKILLAGQYNLYMKTAFDELLPELCKNNDLSKYYSITFLGKGWNSAVKQLSKVGYESKRLGYMDVYLEEIVKYDIQLTPISVGTGTKGKVLDALANGLLVIGTPYAMENIVVENGVSCLQYEHAYEVVNMLHNIISNRKHYEIVAEKGRMAVLRNHNRELISRQFFELFN